MRRTENADSSSSTIGGFSHGEDEVDDAITDVAASTQSRTNSVSCKASLRRHRTLTATGDASVDWRIAFDTSSANKSKRSRDTLVSIISLRDADAHARIECWPPAFGATKPIERKCAPRRPA